MEIDINDKRIFVKIWNSGKKTVADQFTIKKDDIDIPHGNDNGKGAIYLIILGVVLSICVVIALISIVYFKKKNEEDIEESKTSFKSEESNSLTDVINIVISSIIRLD